MQRSSATNGTMTNHPVTIAFNQGHSEGELCTGGGSAQTVHFDEEHQTEENISLTSAESIESGPNPPPRQVKQEENPDGTSQLCLGSSPPTRTFIFEDEHTTVALG